MHANANNINEPDIATNNPLICAICLSFPIVVTFTSIFINIKKAAINAAPLTISPSDNLLISLIATVMSNNAPEILISVSLTFFIALAFPCFAIEENNDMKTRKPARNKPPLPISPSDKPPISLATATSKSSANDIFNNILPNLSIFCADLPLTNVPNAKRTSPIAATKPANPKKPFVAWSGVSELNIFTVAASNNNVTPKEIRAVFIPLILTPSLPIDAEDPDSLDIANANTPKIAASAPIAFTAFHNFSLGIFDNTQTDAAIIPIAMPRFRNIFAIASYFLTFIIPAKLSSIFPTLLNIWPMPLNILLSPSNGAANFSAKSYIFFPE